MAHFAGIGLGATLAPGVLWARMQDAGAKKITLAMITDALALSGLEFTEDERKAMLDAANQNLNELKSAIAIVESDILYLQSRLDPGIGRSEFEPEG